MRFSKLPAALAVAALLAGAALSGTGGPAAHRAAAPATAPAPHTRLVSTSYPTMFGLSDKNEDLRHTTEQQLNIHSALSGYFIHWQQGSGFPSLWTVHHDGAVPVIAWMPSTNLDSVLSGNWDTYIRHWLAGAKAWTYPMAIRLMPEMNAPEPYEIGTNGNTASKFVAAWKHIVQIGRNVGATNVKWVWNPDRLYKGSVAIKPLYPGRYWVDWVALDGYNFGTADRGGWLWFKELVYPTIKAIRNFAPYKPLMIAETGCAVGRYKPQWIAGMFDVAPSLGIKALLYFDFDQARDWRLGTSSYSLAAAKAGVHQSNWRTKTSTFTESKIEYWITHGL